MNRIDKKFKELKAKRKKALIVYITAGDPDLAATGRFVLELDRCGVDIVELGVPFSDPIADGPTIQAASLRSLRRGVNIRDILGIVKTVRRSSDIPIALMTYYNPVHRYGVADFIADASSSGVDGVIVPDLPPEEAGDLIRHSKRRDLKSIFFCAPTSSNCRMRAVSKSSTGFIYYVSLTGVTGARERLPKEVLRNVRLIKGMTRKPVCVGFGISTTAQAASIARTADGVIVGSAVVNIIEKNIGKKDITASIGRFIATLVKAVKAV